MKNRLIEKSFMYLIGNFASKFLAVLLIPIYAFYVTAEELGTYDYLQTLMFFLIPIFFLAIWEAVLKFIITEDDHPKREKIITTITVFALVALIVLLLTIIFSLSFFEYSYTSIITITLMFSLYSLNFIWQYFARSLKENRIYVNSSILGTVVMVVSTIMFLVVANKGLNGLYYSYILGQGISFLYLERKIRIFSYIKIRKFDLLLLKEMLGFSIPLVLNLTAIWGISGFGKFASNYYLGTESTGVYSFSFKFGLVISLIGNVVSMALIEESILRSKENNLSVYFSKVIDNLFKFFFFLCILSLPAINIFYSFIEYTEYYGSLVLIPIFIIYALFMTMSTNIGSIFQAVGKTNIQFTTTIVGSVVTMIFTMILTQRFQLIGIATAQLMGAFSMMISRWILATNIINLKLNYFSYLLYGLVYVLIVYITFFTEVNSYLIFIGVILSVIYINRSYLKQMKIR